MKKKINFYRLLIYFVLVMAVIGFTLPGFLDIGEEEQPPPLRVCQSDADCYLMCQEKPLAVLCYHNLCQQNSCQQESLFPYQISQNTARLEIDIQGEKLNLQKQFEKLGQGNFFVQFQEDSFTAFAPNLTLNHVLDKLRIRLDAQCLAMETENYCQGQEHQLNLLINDNQSYSYGEYPVKNNDQIKITYS